MYTIQPITLGTMTFVFLVWGCSHKELDDDVMLIVVNPRNAFYISVNNYVGCMEGILFGLLPQIVHIERGILLSEVSMYMVL